ncbi:hypothetical protein FRC10_005196 [Ceratobasidium sp. 414]|nr:hypothetical protein FRC10_005196 [Ceratobasidium sp. 414]
MSDAFELLTIPAGLELEFSHAARVETCPRRIEANWNFLWEAKLQQEVTRTRAPNFKYSGQLALVKRNPPLPLPSTAPVTAAPDDFDDDDISEVILSDNERAGAFDSSSDSDSEDDFFEDSPIQSRSQGAPIDNRAHHGRKPQKIPALTVALRNRQPLRAPDANLDSTTASPPATPLGPDSRIVNPPGTDKSAAARRGQDKYYYVDFALVKLAANPGVKKRFKTLMGFKNIPLAKGNIPILIELKRCISRTQRTDNLETLETKLELFIKDGFIDLKRERSAAFDTYPSQKSFVGISISGPWWSFTLVKPTSAKFQSPRSQLFVLGSRSHDKLLSTILDAASTFPENPLAYKKGILEHYVKRFRFDDPYGHQLHLPANEPVPGGVVAFQVGTHCSSPSVQFTDVDVTVLWDGIPADLRLVTSLDLELDEPSLTGETRPAWKNMEPCLPGVPLGERTCMAFMGTLVRNVYSGVDSDNEGPLECSLRGALLCRLWNAYVYHGQVFTPDLSPRTQKYDTRGYSAVVRDCANLNESYIVGGRRTRKLLTRIVTIAPHLSHSVILQNTLTEKFAKPGGIDVSFVDYDGVKFRVSTPEKKTGLLVSISIRCWEELAQYGANDVLQREYGSYITQPEQGYNFSLAFDLEAIPAAGEEREALIKSVALLKRNALAAPFEAAFATQKKLEAAGMPTDGSAPPTGDLMPIHYRDREAIYVRAGFDRVTVVFSTEFQDETDKVVGRVFLQSEYVMAFVCFPQEFVDARRQPSIQNAPQVLYNNREPPLEIRGVAGLNVSDDVGYVTFVIFPRHFANPLVAANTISHIQLFRDYLHYHIKCSKAYMHSRMRHRVTEFLKVLNRAKMETVGEKERKTVTGRTFSSR